MSLKSQLLQAIEFDFRDKTRTESEAWRSPQCQSLAGHKARNYFTSGATVGAANENAHLRPIVMAMIECCEALDLRNDNAPTGQDTQALSRLKELVGG